MKLIFLLTLCLISVSFCQVRFHLLDECDGTNDFHEYMDIVGIDYNIINECYYEWDPNYYSQGSEIDINYSNMLFINSGYDYGYELTGAAWDQVINFVSNGGSLLFNEWNFIYETEGTSCDEFDTCYEGSDGYICRELCEVFPIDIENSNCDEYTYDTEYIITDISHPLTFNLPSEFTINNNGHCQGLFYREGSVSNIFQNQKYDGNDDFASYISWSSTGFGGYIFHIADDGGYSSYTSEDLSLLQNLFIWADNNFKINNEEEVENPLPNRTITLAPNCDALNSRFSTFPGC
eukprot:TRINITY_DN14339_c0_g1_i1.p1 TRINITY_DN14339_c0_g1~~TRINITY_DN14339_c0_g1_i1.p1  ORF type:complete len:314 (+),score=86.31 TRINITY_DN14339_c0_g1_i1:68-943(+)